MPSAMSTTVVYAPLAAVWDTLACFEDISLWGRGVSQSSLLTEVANGLGATRRVQVGRNALRETITVWEPLRSLGYTIVGLPPVVRQASNTWTLANEGSSTRVTLTAEVTTKGGPIIGHLVAGKVGKANKQLLAGLKDHVATS